MRTVRAYSGMLYRFFGTLGKPPNKVTAPDVFGYAHSVGLSGKKPSSVTINARIACLSSFYRFLIQPLSGSQFLGGESVVVSFPQMKK